MIQETAAQPGILPNITNEWETFNFIFQLWPIILAFISTNCHLCWSLYDTHSSFEFMGSCQSIKGKKRALKVLSLPDTFVIKDENPSSFVRLVKILGILNLCSILMWFLGVFLINISPEYQSTLFPFLYCYFLGPVDTFFILLVTVTVILAGVDCVLASKKSTFDTTRLFFMVVPLLAIVCLVYAFRNRQV